MQIWYDMPTATATIKVPAREATDIRNICDELSNNPVLSSTSASAERAYKTTYWNISDNYYKNSKYFSVSDWLQIHLLILYNQYALTELRNIFSHYSFKIFFRFWLAQIPQLTLKQNLKNFSDIVKINDFNCAAAFARKRHGNQEALGGCHFFWLSCFKNGFPLHLLIANMPPKMCKLKSRSRTKLVSAKFAS